MSPHKNLTWCDATFLGYLSRPDNDGYDICFSIAGQQHLLPYYRKQKRNKRDDLWDKRTVLNKIGSIQKSEQGYYFEIYYDQSLRRASELDIKPNSHDTPISIGWRNATHPEGFLAPSNIIPGFGGNFVPDNSKGLFLLVPDEFATACDQHGVSAETVLNDFINNVGNFICDNRYPRADFRVCEHISWHQLALAYLQSIYGRKEV